MKPSGSGWSEFLIEVTCIQNSIKPLTRSSLNKVGLQRPKNKDELLSKVFISQNYEVLNYFYLMTTYYKNYLLICLNSS